AGDLSGVVHARRVASTVAAGILACRRASASRPAERTLEMPVGVGNSCLLKTQDHGSGRQDALPRLNSKMRLLEQRQEVTSFQINSNRTLLLARRQDFATLCS